MRRRSPRPLAAAVGAAREEAAPRTILAAVQQVWREVAGEQIAAVSTPSAERADILVVSCRDAVWAEELDLMQERLLAALRERLGELAPRALRFEASGPGTP